GNSRQTEVSARRLSALEDKPLAHGEVEQGAERNRNPAGQVMVDVQPAGKQAHQNHVSQDGYHAVSGVETSQAEQGRTAASARPILPGIAFMPGEVMQHRRLHCQGGGRQVVQMKDAEQKRKASHLNQNAEGANRIELEPAYDERRHGRRSARYNSRV